MTQTPDKEEFALFLDESGSAKPNPKDKTRCFAMGGVIVRRADEARIATSVAEFKDRWKIDQAIPLHGNEIRSEEKSFKVLQYLICQKNSYRSK